jgi:hypothetical protein
MTALRLVPLPLHAALEMLAGLAIMILPFALEMSPAGMITGAVIGALVVGMALQAVDVGRSSSVAGHHAADFGVALGLAGAAILFATTDGAAAVLFGAAALAQLALNVTTRYTAR